LDLPITVSLLQVSVAGQAAAAEHRDALCMLWEGQAAKLTTRGARRFQILSLDGGGLRGMFSAAVLAKLEEDLDLRIVDHFDLIAGTSTGGIIALGLGLGMSPRQILEFYTATAHGSSGTGAGCAACATCFEPSTQQSRCAARSPRFWAIESSGRAQSAW
jgi:hypothetical protein